MEIMPTSDEIPFILLSTSVNLIFIANTTVDCVILLASLKSNFCWIGTSFRYFLRAVILHSAHVLLINDEFSWSNTLAGTGDFRNFAQMVRLHWYFVPETFKTDKNA